METIKVGYLGPEGTFTHQAAGQLFSNNDAEGVNPAGNKEVELYPLDNVAQVFQALETGQIHYGVAAIDNTVEGPVFATIDGLLQSADVVAVADMVLPIRFDAYALAGSGPHRVGVAHPHALAQVSQALARFGVEPLTAASNGAALANLAPGQIAFGPPGFTGPNVVTLAENVGDYPEAQTQFVLLANRAATKTYRDATGWQTLLAVTPGVTGPGVLARITEQFARRNLNLSALISRPIKGRAGKYVFIVTVDAAPWEPPMRALLADLLAADDAVKTLGIWQKATLGENSAPGVEGGIPPGSAQGIDSAAALEKSLLW